MNLIIKVSGEKSCNELLKLLHTMGYKWRDGTIIVGYDGYLNTCGMSWKWFNVYLFINKKKSVISYRQQFGNEINAIDYKENKKDIAKIILEHKPEDNKNAIVSLNKNYPTE